MSDDMKKKRRVLSLNPGSPASRAAAHRAMAKAALYSESSDSVRLTRYKNHMKKASELDELSKLEEAEITEQRGICDERQALSHGTDQ